MKKIFTSRDVNDVFLLRGYLEGSGIECLLKNEKVLNGELSAYTWPEIWILDDTLLDKAQAIVNDWTMKKDIDDK